LPEPICQFRRRFSLAGTLRQFGCLECRYAEKARMRWSSRPQWRRAWTAQANGRSSPPARISRSTLHRTTVMPGRPGRLTASPTLLAWLRHWLSTPTWRAEPSGHPYRITSLSPARQAADGARDTVASPNLETITVLGAPALARCRPFWARVEAQSRASARCESIVGEDG
jgi:hypothetical protein